ncbi:MAG: enoyl-CoA hydratase/isomerase family protein [Acidobacteria bacterium]|nr:enoyl-CoA hydratase/isomerase family protein [Acidobacteriota bacterium]
MSALLEIVREGRVLHLVLNRPDKRNALNADLCRDLVDSLDAAHRDRQTGAILLTGKGRSFCAGMDLREIEEGRNSLLINTLHEQLFTAAMRLEIPIVAGVHGAALGGGTGLVANCHIVVAAPDATFGLTEIRLGLWPFLVFRAVGAALGERRTIELALTGRTFPAAEAREMGLVHEIAADPSARAAEIARALAESSPTAIRSGLGFVNRARGMSWEKAGEVARSVREDVFASADFAEGIRAFLEKRRPEWPSLGEKDALP